MQAFLSAGILDPGFKHRLGWEELMNEAHLPLRINFVKDTRSFMFLRLEAMLPRNRSLGAADM